MGKAPVNYSKGRKSPSRIVRAKHGGAGPLQLVGGTMLSAARLFPNSAPDRHPNDGVPGRREQLPYQRGG